MPHRRPRRTTARARRPASVPCAFDEGETVPSPPPKTAEAVPAARVSVRHLTKCFGGVTAVDDVSFDLAPGKALAVIGPNGAGKSSLLKLLCGVHRPDQGTVQVGDVAVELLTPHAVAAAGIGVAHQIPRPFKDLTVRENILIGAMVRHAHRPRERQQWVQTVLETCGLTGKAAQPAGSLPLLDLKRLELARALSVDPALILLDEVAAGLNGRDLEEVIGLIRTIHQQGRSLILVEHVEGVVASLVDEVLVLDWGKAIARGTPAEIADDPRVREVYLGTGHGPAPTAPAGPPPRQRPAPLLQMQSVTAAYGDITALHDVSVEVGDGEIVAVLGANGAGKSTLAATLSGQLRPAAGRVLLDGRDISREPAFVRNRDGIAHCPEGRKIFGDLTVRENLLLGPGVRLSRTVIEQRLRDVHDIFPQIADIPGQRASSLSGGQQQMLAIARALMSRPRVLICDEISLGLAPVAIDALYQALPVIRERGVAMLLVEQNVQRSLAVADHTYVLERGRLTYAGPPGPLFDPDTLAGFYFGTSHLAPHPAA